ncbi:MAG: DUF1566 domain-containing protein [Candidatus Falkowbacteria bacterium]
MEYKSDTNDGRWEKITDGNTENALVGSGVVVKDKKTGLYWSDAYDSDKDGNPDIISNEFQIVLQNGGNGCDNADINAGNCDAGKFQKKGKAIEHCENLLLDANGDGVDENDWRLPTQKELMQAYLDGSNTNLPNSGHFFWSATESSYALADMAWYVDLGSGLSLEEYKRYGNYSKMEKLYDSNDINYRKQIDTFVCDSIYNSGGIEIPLVYARCVR